MSQPPSTTALERVQAFLRLVEHDKAGAVFHYGHELAVADLKEAIGSARSLPSAAALAITIGEALWTPGPTFREFLVWIHGLSGQDRPTPERKAELQINYLAEHILSTQDQQP